MKLSQLSLVTVLLFFISLGVFYHDTQRGEGTLEGRAFLKGLNIAGVSKVEFTQKNSDKITFLRSGDYFILESHKNFPAENSKINDLLFKLSNLKIKEKVAEQLDQSELKTFEVAESDYQYAIKLYDEKGDYLSSFKIGKTWKGKGRYLLKESTGEVFLSAANLWLNGNFDSFISKSILKLKNEDIAGVKVNGLNKVSISLENDEVVFEGKNKDKFSEEKSKKYLNSLTSLSFEKYFDPTDKEVRGLKFKHKIQLKTKDKHLYEIELAKKGKDYFARAKALMDESKNTFVLRQDDGTDKLFEIDNVVKSQAKAQSFNQKRAAWIYKISESDYEKWHLSPKELI